MQRGNPHQPGRGGRPASFLARLARDARGNTLAIVGAALIPLTAMIGSGVDMSRAYMAQARLQSACDAASLAGRRVMTNDTLDANVTNEALKYFNFNYPQGLYGTNTFTPSVTRPSQGVVKVTASSTIPTGVMYLFGYATMNISATCQSEQNFVNTDIVLVLDTTGSMLEDSNNNATSNTANQKITALRDAVMALYDELAPIQTQLEAAGMRLRYGIVPYSSAVNVGGILDSGYIANSWTYQSRSPIYRQSQTSQAFTGQTSSQCTARGQALPGWNITFPVTEKLTSLSGSKCTVTTNVYDRPVTANFGFWYHEQRTLDTSQFKTFSNSVPLPTRTPGTSTTAQKWNGCIEERATVSTIDASSGYTIPTGATDLNIDQIPSSDATRWKPRWPEVEYMRAANATTDPYTILAYLNPAPSRYGAVETTSFYSDNQLNACPTPAKRLQKWTRSDLQNYINTLDPDGYTYHDVGMIWGARLISDGGVFADSPTTYNGMPVAKHIIFLTDGVLNTTPYNYSAYGNEVLDQRITGSPSAPQQSDRHKQRFKMICNAAKGKNVSIWVVGLSTTLDDTVAGCASNTSQVSVSNTRDELIDKFTEIGKNIGALRLTQ